MLKTRSGAECEIYVNAFKIYALQVEGSLLRNLVKSIYSAVDYAE